MDARQALLAQADEFEKRDMGDGIFVRAFSKQVFSQIEAMTSQEKRTADLCTNIRWTALKWSLVDENSEPLLQLDDRQKFDSMNARVIERYFEAALDLSGVTGDDKETFRGN